MRVPKIVTFILFILAVSAVFVFSNFNKNKSHSLTDGKVSWTFNGRDDGWETTSKLSNCSKIQKLPSPVDVNLVSGILYPGQIRGTDYKPHGGFRFDNLGTNEVEVRAIMDGYVIKASRYEVDGEIQNMLFYVSDCGVMVLNDHLLTPSPRLKEMFDKIPVGKNGDSRTTFIEPRFNLRKGELLATEVGFKKNKNIFLDFGLYDLSKTNDVFYDESFRNNNPSVKEYGVHGLCWFDYLEDSDAAIVRSLPAGGREGKVSDYCD